MLMQDISIKIPRLVHKYVRKKAIDWDVTVETAYGRLLHEKMDAENKQEEKQQRAYLQPD